MTSSTEPAGGDWTRVRPSDAANSRSISVAPAEASTVAYYDRYSGLTPPTSGSRDWTNVLVDGAARSPRSPAGTRILSWTSDHGHISCYYRLADPSRRMRRGLAVGSRRGGRTSSSRICRSSPGTVVICSAGRIYIAHKIGGVWARSSWLGQRLRNTDRLDGRRRRGRRLQRWMTAKTYMAVESGGSFNTREILPHTSDGEGPSLAVRGQTAHVLSWDQNTQRVEYVTAALDPAGVVDVAGQPSCAYTEPGHRPPVTLTPDQPVRSPGDRGRQRRLVGVGRQGRQAVVSCTDRSRRQTT
jgi:hypothetical protein